MTDYTEPSKGQLSETGALKEKITALTNQIKEMASPEGVDEIVHESPYIIAGIALIVGLVVGVALASRLLPRQGW